MLIEQNIEFELRGSEPPGRTCTPITGYFHEKTKISKENLRVDYYFLLKYCRRQCSLLSPSGQNKSLTIKFQQQITRFFTCFGIKLQVKED